LWENLCKAKVQAEVTNVMSRVEAVVKGLPRGDLVT